MRFEIDRAASLRTRAAKLLQLAREAAEPRRSELVGLAEEHAREAFALARARAQTAR